MCHTWELHVFHLQLASAYSDLKQELFSAAAEIPNKTHPNSVCITVYWQFIVFCMV
jgi:hypothetical protein